MSKRQLEDYLQDILEAISAIEQFPLNLTFETFSQNLEKVFVVLRAIEIIGQAVKWFAASVRDQYSEVP